MSFVRGYFPFVPPPFFFFFVLSLCRPLAQFSDLLHPAISQKVDDAFKAFKYVPYLSLTHAAQLKAARGEEDFVINVQGGVTSKGLDCRDEKSISLSDWLGAAKTAEERTRVYHGEARASVLAAHHGLVADIARLHNWSLTVDYDIQQRELVALSPSHDLSTLDQQALTIIATCHLLQAVHSHPPSSSLTGTKRPAPDTLSSSPQKQPRLCFQCGFAGHMPVDCKSESTSAGKPVTPLASGTKSKNTLLGPNNKPYCFNWAKDSSCSFGNSCNNLHACSLPWRQILQIQTLILNTCSHPSSSTK